MDDPNMNDLEKYFFSNSERPIDKWHHYFDIYDRHFSPFRGTDVHVVEIGIYQGGSLQMWKNYFGPDCQIHGVDISPQCKQCEEDRIKIFIGDQADKDFLNQLKSEIPRIDILIDDGGHTMEQQINTFEVLFPHISEHGVYLCEDMQTSYWKKWGGGYKNPASFIEYSKNFIDELALWHYDKDKDGKRVKSEQEVPDFTRAAHSMSYYDSVLVIEKRPIPQPRVTMTGDKFIAHPRSVLSKMRKVQRNLTRSL